MKVLIFALALSFLVGLFAMPGFAKAAYASDVHHGPALTASASYRTVARHRYYRSERDFGHNPPIVNHYNYYYGEPEPYYGYYYYPPYYSYYYGPGFTIDLPFFSFHIG